MSQSSLHLVVRRLIRASPERLFEAWTTAEQLRAWWGPQDVRCSDALIDARVGGHYRIANELPNGRIVVISGNFLEVERPKRLVYTWHVDGEAAAHPELVTIRFEARGDATEVIVVHEQIPEAKKRDEHALGWEGCLAGLAAFFDDASAHERGDAL